MTCDRFREQMEEWLDGILGPEAHADLERHVLSCAACAQTLDQRRRVGAVLKKTMHELTSDLHFQPQRQSSLRAGKPLLRRPQRLRFNPATLAALAVVAFVALLFLFQPWVKLRQKSTVGELPIAVITVNDSLDAVDESFISGRIAGVTYLIHLQVSTVEINDHS